jgi:glycosyltransferase involved in cell wall biosynthesis
MIPTVTVITRTKKRANFLARCKLSIENQIFTDFEWIVVYDGLIDEETRVVLGSINRLSLKLIIVELGVAKGMEAASNAGLKVAKGKFITFLDDDDSWSPQFLKSCVNFLESNLNFKGVVTQTVVIKEKVNYSSFAEKSRYVFNPNLLSIAINLLCKSNIFTNNSFVFYRSVIKEIGVFDESLVVKGDWDFNLRFIEKYDIGVIPIPLAYWHHHEMSSVSSRNSIVNNKVEHRVFEDLIRNKYFRRDITMNQLSIGFLLEFHKNENVFFKPRGFFRRLKSFFGV